MFSFFLQLDATVLQLCNDGAVVKVLGGVIELTYKGIPLLVLTGIVQLQLIGKKLCLQCSLQRDCNSFR